MRIAGLLKERDGVDITAAAAITGTLYIRRLTRHHRFVRRSIVCLISRLASEKHPRKSIDV
jgi:hypothetical protein